MYKKRSSKTVRGQSCDDRKYLGFVKSGVNETDVNDTFILCLVLVQFQGNIWFRVVKGCVRFAEI